MLDSELDQPYSQNVASKYEPGERETPATVSIDSLGTATAFLEAYRCSAASVARTWNLVKEYRDYPQGS